MPSRNVGDASPTCAVKSAFISFSCHETRLVKRHHAALLRQEEIRKRFFSRLVMPPCIKHVSMRTYLCLGKFLPAAPSRQRPCLPTTKHAPRDVSNKHHSALESPQLQERVVLLLTVEGCARGRAATKQSRGCRRASTNTFTVDVDESVFVHMLFRNVLDWHSVFVNII